MQERLRYLEAIRFSEEFPKMSSEVGRFPH